MLDILLITVYIIVIITLLYVIIYFGKNIIGEVKITRQLNKIMKNISKKEGK